MVEKDENSCINVIFYSAALHTCCSCWEVEKINAKSRRGGTTGWRQLTTCVQCMVWASPPPSVPSLTPAGNILHWHSHLLRNPHAIVGVLYPSRQMQRIIPGRLFGHRQVWLSLLILYMFYTLVETASLLNMGRWNQNPTDTLRTCKFLIWIWNLKPKAPSWYEMKVLNTVPLSCPWIIMQSFYRLEWSYRSQTPLKNILNSEPPWVVLFNNSINCSKMLLAKLLCQG